MEWDSWPGLYKGLSPHTVPVQSCHGEQEHSVARFLISLLLNFCKNFQILKKPHLSQTTHPVARFCLLSTGLGLYAEKREPLGLCLPGYCHFLSVGSWASELISEPLSYLQDVDRNGYGSLKITLPRSESQQLAHSRAHQTLGPLICSSSLAMGLRIPLSDIFLPRNPLSGFRIEMWTASLAWWCWSAILDI